MPSQQRNAPTSPSSPRRNVKWDLKNYMQSPDNAPAHIRQSRCALRGSAEYKNRKSRGTFMPGGLFHVKYFESRAPGRAKKDNIGRIRAVNSLFPRDALITVPILCAIYLPVITRGDFSNSLSGRKDAIIYQRGFFIEEVMTRNVLRNKLITRDVREYLLDTTFLFPYNPSSAEEAGLH